MNSQPPVYHRYGESLRDVQQTLNARVCNTLQLQTSIGKGGSQASAVKLPFKNEIMNRESSRLIETTKSSYNLHVTASGVQECVSEYGCLQVGRLYCKLHIHIL